VPSLVGQLARAIAENHPNRIAVMTDTGRALTRRELHLRSNRLANTLLGAGLRPGDRVAVWMEDVIECVETYVALSKASLVGVPIGKLLTSTEAAFVLSDVDARGVVFTSGIAERLPAALEVSGCDPKILIGVGRSGVRGSRTYHDALAEGSDRTPTAVQDQVDQDVLIGYTSGTTGFPKGALVRENSLRNIISMSATARRLHLNGLGLMTASLSFPAILPADIFTHLYVGGTICLVDGWDVDKVLSLVESTRATYMYLPSPAISDFVSAVAENPQSIAPLRTIMHSGSKAAPDKIRSVCDVVDGRFVEIWGMMENSGGPVTATTEADYLGGEAADIYSSVGRAVPQCAVRSLDPAGEPLPAGSDNVGELVVHSAALFSGYWNNEEATGRALADGWYHTGDLGWIDDAGYVYIVDRRSDLIVSGGMNIYPSEIERVISAHPSVAHVAVVGVPHERWGRTPVAVVVLREGAAVTEADLLAHCRRSLASYKKPTRVFFTPKLHHNASGKIVRRAIEEWAVHESGLSAATPGS
jgi:acyl-CoA synthetase (AMP-forming)/AMP-acid ligase II